MAGMAQLHKRMPGKKEKFRLGLLLLKYLKWRFPTKAAGLLKSEQIMCLAAGNECYLSNIAVYPEFRRLGIGTKLLEAVEKEARSIGKKRIVLKAETHNKRAIALYERLGYRIEEELPVFKLRNRVFESFKICKQIS